MKAIRSLYRFLGLFLAGGLFCCQGQAVAGDLLKTEYSYRRYTIHDGLPEIPSYALLQDKRGFIWVGTLNGFARYDGQTFKTFLSDSDEGIVDFVENNNGDVTGLSLYRLHRVLAGSDSLRSLSATADITYCYEISQTLPHGYGVYQEEKSRALFSITDSGPVKIWEHVLLNRMDEGRKLHWDRETRQFWIPTDRGIYLVGEDGAVKDSFDVKTISSFALHRNELWAVADEGLYKYDNRKLQPVFKHDFFQDSMRDYLMMEDADHNLIIRTDKAVYRYIGGSLETIAGNISQTYDICIDQEGNLWLATADGVYNFFRLNFKNYKLLPEGSVIMSVVVDRQNRVWLPSFEGKLICLEGDKSTQVNYPQPLSPEKYFYRGARIIDNDLYLPGSGSVLRYNPDNRASGWLDLPPDAYFCVSPAEGGELIIGGFGDVYRYRPGKGVVRHYGMDEIRQMALCSVVDQQGRIWLGGSEGIVIIDGDSIRSVFNDTVKTCRHIICDPSGTIWLGCRNRLVSFAGNKAYIAHTFQNTLIRSIWITRGGIMVVATVDAVYLSKDANYSEFVRYDQYNGFNALGPLSVSMSEDRDGYVWLLSLESAVRFNPGDLVRRQPVPVLHVQQVQASPDNIHWEDVSRDRMVLPHTDNNVRFSYIGLCYSATGNIRYQYRLTGFQDEWSPLISEREITFNNLPPGHYEFQIKASAGMPGTETDVITTPFTVRPAFWQTWWFVVVIVLLLMLASTGIALYIQRRKNSRLIERLETEKQLNELRVKSIRLRSIPHFNANVLAAIEYYVMNLSKDDANRLLNIYSEFTSQTLREVDKASRSLHDELDYVQLYLKLEKLRFMEKFNYEVDIDPEVKQDVQLPNMILHTYCENAVKHGFSGRASGCRLKISARQKADVVEVCVEDNGVGRAAAAQNKNIRSTKQGLDILSRQIEIYNRFNKKKIVQTIIDLYDGDTPCGTRFMIEVPYGFVYY